MAFGYSHSHPDQKTCKNALKSTVLSSIIFFAYFAFFAIRGSSGGLGRERKIQGDVVLEVIFLGSGQIKVTRVVSGLGFAMDDEAIHAAQRIRFTPATLRGKPVDFPARIRIEFRLVRVENPSELPR